MNDLSSEVTLETTRDRVYIYIDENLVLSRRDANLILEYTGKDGKTVITKKLAIGQLPLIKINVGNGDIIYMEQIEEYLNHYDPLDEFDDQQLYSGLPWGNNGTFKTLHWDAYGIGNAICNPELIRYNGYEYSGYMIQTMGQGVLKLYEKPLSALQYCHNRNKRKEDGTVPYLAGRWGIETWWHITENKTKWFLPGITEMENALTQQYNVFPEFQNNFYWSCSVSEEEGQTSGQDETRARATKILPDGGYIQSGGQWPEYPASGRAKRTEKLRIRAFRNDLNPADY